MEEIKVEEYVRTKGKIFKIYEVYKCLGDNFVIVKNKNGFPSRIDLKENKHSKDIIDLIEKDDYINGCRVYEVEEKGITVYQKVEDSSVDYNWIAKDEIETIWTKEQLKTIEYNVN